MGSALGEPFHPSSSAISPRGCLAPPPQSSPTHRRSRCRRLPCVPAPLDLDYNPRSCPPQCRNALPGLKRVLLAGAGLLRGHPSDGRLGVREDGDPLGRDLSPGSQFQRPYKGGALYIVGLLVVTHMGFDAPPGQAVFPHHHLPGGSVVQPGPVSEHDNPRSSFQPPPWLRPPLPATVRRQGFPVPLAESCSPTLQRRRGHL